MPEQYVAQDRRTGVEVSVTGEFPPHPDDRVRIARTATLFTRLISTLLANENEAERRLGFRAIETQLELAEAMIRQDAGEVQRLVRETLQNMGVGEEQLQDLARQLREMSGIDPEIGRQLAQAFGLDDPSATPDETGDAEAEVTVEPEAAEAEDAADPSPDEDEPNEAAPA